MRFQAASNMFKKIIYLSFITLMIGLPLFSVNAQYTPGGGTFLGIENPLKADSFTELLENIITWVTGIASTVAILMVIIAGFQYMTSGGDESKTKSALNTIKWSLIGLVIILMSWGLLKEVLSILSARS
jgi:type IV secretory pathway VirB2 component (pilin)